MVSLGRGRAAGVDGTSSWHTRVGGFPNTAPTMMTSAGGDTVRSTHPVWLETAVAVASIDVGGAPFTFGAASKHSRDVNRVLRDNNLARSAVLAALAPTRGRPQSNR